MEVEYSYIFLTKNHGTEIDFDGWKTLISLCPNIQITKAIDDISGIYTLFGGVYEIDYSIAQFSDIYWSWGVPNGGCALNDPTNTRFGCYLSNFPTWDINDEHLNDLYVVYGQNYDLFANSCIDGTFGISCGGGNMYSLHNYSKGSGERYDSPYQCMTPQSAMENVDWSDSTSFGNINLIGRFLTEFITFQTNAPLFLRSEDLAHYIETGEKINCINDVTSEINTGSNRNKYCETEILTMDANGHNKHTAYKYNYTYKISENQDIVGYVKDDSNDINVRFKCKNENSAITIINNDTGTSTILTGEEFNNNVWELSYGCSTTREHELFSGKICWGVFGRMNIYIFDDENKADAYFETGDPTLAINYDDVDEYDERKAHKTGEDVGDQKNQMNALVEGWEEPSLSNVYILNATKMKQVAELIFPNVDTAGELPQAMKDLKASLGLYGENPINDIIDVWHCPINPSTMVGRETRNLIFGSYRSNISGTCVTSHGIIKNLGATVISPIYNDFRDYEMEIVLYLPYFGTVDLPCDIYMGKQIDIKATIDLRSHNLRYYIFTNNTLMEYHDCAIGTSYPLMGQDVAGKASQTIKSYNMVKTAQRNATISAGMSIVNGAIGLMTGNPSQFVQSGANIEQTNANIALQKKQFEHDVKYTQPPRSIVGSSSPSCSENDIPYPYIVFKIPQTIKPPLLQNTYGLPSNIVTRIGDVSGYAQIENVQLQSSLPLRIQADILNKLANGVVIN